MLVSETLNSPHLLFGTFSLHFVAVWGPCIRKGGLSARQDSRYGLENCAKMIFCHNFCPFVERTCHEILPIPWIKIHSYYFTSWFQTFFDIYILGDIRSNLTGHLDAIFFQPWAWLEKKNHPHGVLTEALSLAPWWRTLFVSAWRPGVRNFFFMGNVTCVFWFIESVDTLRFWGSEKHSFFFLQKCKKLVEKLLNKGSEGMWRLDESILFGIWWM